MLCVRAAIHHTWACWCFPFNCEIKPWRFVPLVAFNLRQTVFICAFCVAMSPFAWLHFGLDNRTAVRLIPRVITRVTCATAGGLKSWCVLHRCMSPYVPTQWRNGPKINLKLSKRVPSFGVRRVKRLLFYPPHTRLRESVVSVRCTPLQHQICVFFFKNWKLMWWKFVWMFTLTVHKFLAS